MAAHNNKLRGRPKDRVLELLSQDESGDKVIEIIKKEFGREVTAAAISYYNVHYADRIHEMRVKFYQSEILKQPIAHKGFRVRRAMIMLNRAEEMWEGAGTVRDQKDAESVAAMAMKSVREELGEDAEKIIFQITTGDNHFHINFSELDDDERKRIARNNRFVLDQFVSTN